MKSHPAGQKLRREKGFCFSHTVQLRYRNRPGNETWLPRFTHWSCAWPGTCLCTSSSSQTGCRSGCPLWPCFYSPPSWRQKKRSRSSWEHFGLSAAVRRWRGTSRQMWHRGAGGGSLIGHDGARLPFLQLRGGDQPGEVGSAALHSALPPVGILLVDDLDDVTGLELQARLFARDEVILGGVVVELRPHVHLQIKQNVTRLLFGRAKKKEEKSPETFAASIWTEPMRSILSHDLQCVSWDYTIWYPCTYLTLKQKKTTDIFYSLSPFNNKYSHEDLLTRTFGFLQMLIRP